MNEPLPIGARRYLDAAERGLFDEIRTTEPGGPVVVTLCGSMRFYPHMLDVAAAETLAGRIVLAPFAVVAPADQGSDSKRALDELHREKIRMCSEVIVVTDETGYFGESTRGEIEYALSIGKSVTVRPYRPGSGRNQADD